MDIKESYEITKAKNNSVVYVISNPVSKLVKVGITCGIKNRMNALATCGGVDLNLDYHTKPLASAYKLEKKVHKKIDDRRCRGEWFNVDVDEVVELVRSMEFDCKASMFYDMFNEFGGNRSAIAKKLGVSRSYIARIVRDLGLGCDPLHKINELEFRRSKKERIKSDSDYLVVPKNKRNGQFKRRVEVNVYTNGECFKATKFIGGVIVERYFMTIEDCRSWLVLVEKD